MKIHLFIFSLLILASSALAITAGQQEVRVYNGTGFTSYYVTVVDGQIIGKSSGAPTAITLNATAVGLGSVENTALSGWAGTSNLTTVGTITAGAWQGTAIADSYIASAATWNAKQAALGNGGFTNKFLTWGGSSWTPTSASAAHDLLLPGAPSPAFGTYAWSWNGTSFGWRTMFAGSYDFFKLKAYVADNIAPTDVGMGWADGKFTIQSPGGALQLYETGDPAEATLYWPGRITVNTLEATAITGSISGTQVDNGSIPSGVIASSMTAPLREFQDTPDYAGANGLTYANTGPLSSSQPTTVGNYFACVDVVSGGGTVRNYLKGTVRTHAEMNVPKLVTAPTTATSTGTAGQIAYDASYFYVCTATNTWVRAALSTW